MTDNQQDKVKVRFKFRSGEEFEAEGNPDFIEKQRADFLQLIGKDSPAKSARKSMPVSQPAPAPNMAQNDPPATQYPAPTNPDYMLSPETKNTTRTDTAINHTEPAFYRRNTHPAYTPQQPGMSELTEESVRSTISQGRSAAETRYLRQTAISSDEIRLWEQLVRIDDRLVILRRKSRQISADSAAILLIAAAKILLKQADGYSALCLSKSLKKSGYGGERLDRVLGGELKRGIVRSDGTKRARAYALTNEGFTRAYVLAHKLAGEWQ